MQLNRRTFVAAAGFAALAGCVSDGDGEPSSDGNTPSDIDTAGATSARTASPNRPTQECQRQLSGGSTTTVAPGPYDLPPSAEPRLPLPMSRESLRFEVRSGGPSKDGIPSIDDPILENAADISLLDPGDPVFGLVRDGVPRAYPQKVLVRHEICNDTVAGDTVAITYCPLTGTAMGFERGETTFGVSGRLVHSNLIMYDRELELWWPQVLASSIPSPWSDSTEAASLREVRLIWTTWERWQKQYPETKVLTGGENAFSAPGDPYGSYNPKEGYYEEERQIGPRLETDDQFHPKRVVLGTRTADGAAAFLKESLREQGTMTGELDGNPIVAVYDPALDTGYLYHNPEETDVSVDGCQAQVGGASYDPNALSLKRLYAFDAMWFAWSGFYPDTNTYE